MHEEIQRFNLHGTLADREVPQTRERLVEFIESMMRDQGYVPALDLEPQFTLDYNPETEEYTFALSVYGVRFDKDETWNVSGILSGKAVPRYTPKNKSQPSSNTAAS